MAGEVEELKTVLEPTELGRFAEDEVTMEHAVKFAINMVNQRRAFTPAGTLIEEYEPAYRQNVIDGAIWYLRKLGGEGFQSMSENGVSIQWQAVPDWLKYVRPKIGMI